VGLSVGARPLREQNKDHTYQGRIHFRKRDDLFFCTLAERKKWTKETRVKLRCT
jgi:hypothetical protein